MKRRIASRCLAGLLTLILTVTTLGTSLVEASTGDIDAAIVAESLQVAKQVEAEGIVLLKNEDGVLPLAAEQAVSVFGSAAIDPYYGSSGSGSIKSDTMMRFLQQVLHIMIPFINLTGLGMERTAIIKKCPSASWI